MDRDDWLELNRRGMEATFSAFARSAGADLIQGDGLTAIVNGRAPERSVFNSVVYSDPEELAARRDELAARYARHGCAWTVWVPAQDAGTAEALERAGHRLDAEPRAMGAELAAPEEPDLTGLDWTDAAGLEVSGPLNDRAYGYPEGTWLRGAGPDPEGLVTYVVFIDGEPASTAAALDCGTDCSVWNVATAEAARGRGLATRLMRKIAFDAAARGCRTTTLQATRLGAPVYAAVGYRDFGALQMWEWRE
jgi:ribosomal protein S18 acetylase RimI-like enzyme